MESIKSWAVDTGVRAVKTTAQTFGALLGASAFDVLHGVPWSTDLGVALGAGLLCVLHNINSLPLGSAEASADESVDVPGQAA